MEEVNWIAVAVAAASTLLVGFIWYNPKTFGKVLYEGKENDGGKHQVWLYPLSVVLAGVIAYKLSGGAYHHPEEYRHALHGAFHGMLTSLYLVVPVMLTNLLFEGRNWKVITLHITYWIASFALMGAILYAFSGAGY